jgi:NitT/TauT family transport system substrate-binding protein
MKRFLALGLVIIVALVLSVSSCTSGQQEDTSLRIALLPIMDTLPLYVAEQEGYFAAEGITVEPVPVKSPTERDALMQANEVDGMLTDLHGVGLFNQETPQVKVIGMARKAYPDSPLFRLLAAPNTDIDTVQDLAGVPIGISQNTVIEYITDRMLQQSGLNSDQIVVQEITAIPVRFEQLMAGQVQAATLPDPLAQGAVATGANLIVDDSQFTQYSQSVLVFGMDSIEAKPATLTKFLRAWYKAAADLNQRPEDYRDLLIEKGRVPESIQGTFAMPPFPEKEITSPEQWADVVDWLIDKGLIDREIPYDQAVDDDLLDATSQSGAKARPLLDDAGSYTARAIVANQRWVEANQQWVEAQPPLGGLTPTT